MSSWFRSAIVLAMVLGVPSLAIACLWDYDTLRQERARFPTTLELIAGKFLRHSPEFYEWRVRDRLKKLAADPANLAYHDDLAVAYQKTGQHAKAIETILAKEKVKPGLYETYSNLGTFHILEGNLEAGLPYIDKALAINPDAHFGRERYQKWLVEYAIQQRREGKLVFPLRPSHEEKRSGPASFAKFLSQRLGKEHLTEEDLQEAVTGVLGMMRFANHDNPLLLEALGDLLLGSYESVETDAKRLAVRCYLKASYTVKDQAAREGYRAMAGSFLKFQTRGALTQDGLELSEIEADFAAELADAEAWYAALKAKEASWIRDGKDADAEFDRLYSEEPEVAGNVTEAVIGFGLENKLLLGIGLAAVLLAGIVVIMVRRRRRRPTGSAA